ncbi:hypothetical protein HA72_1644 [Metallosphaera sedula]|uniref:Uncharacterized protein n=2 Tax=Metallosphaera sedula TaxID=43687 RepID=A4YH97_METS5|nr:hypothetical protein Msed_1644 [Metallosphaera sedula DSM 5348]AIM27783.1 hypothetical protein HA72_1644 [Metallosphaera sedula]
MKAQSEFIAFIIAIILIVVILVPLAFLVLDFSKPSAQQVDEISVLRRQIDGGSILLFFNSTPSKSTLLTIRGGSNYTLEGVFYDYHGQWINISNKITPSVPAPSSTTSPSPLTYGTELFSSRSQVTTSQFSPLFSPTRLPSHSNSLSPHPFFLPQNL